tara:strand:- start:167252 stop:167518 length:267 start_codon:yes stop_codon:yes gene_type:complete
MAHSMYATRVNEIHAHLQDLAQPLDGEALLQLNHTGTRKHQVQSGDRQVDVIEVNRLRQYYLMRDAWRAGVQEEFKEVMEDHFLNGMS